MLAVGYFLKRDSDGYWFVNGFCRGFYTEEQLRRVRAVIEEGLKNSKEIFFQKWRWLALQFNEELKHFGFDIQAIIV